MLGPVWIPLESVSGPKNLGTIGGKLQLAFDGRMILIWHKIGSAGGRIQLLHPAGMLMSPLRQ